MTSCSSWYYRNAVAYRGVQRGWVAPGGTSEGAAFSGKWSNLRKKGKIYVKKGKILSVNGQKSWKLWAAQAKGGTAEGVK